MKNFFRANLFAVLGLVSLTIVLTTAASHAALDPRYVTYDSITGITNGVNGSLTATAGTPRSFIGDDVNFYYPDSGSITITGMDLGFAYRGAAATTLSALTVNLKFYELISISNSVFTDPVTSVLSFDIRQPIVDSFNAQNGTNFTVNNFVFNPGENYFYQLAFPTTFAFADRNLNGIAVNYSANAGTGTFSDDTLTSVLRVGPALALGTSGISDDRGGFFRNLSGRTDYNFDQGDKRTLTSGAFTDHAGLAMRFYTDRVVVIPEANTLALLCLGTVFPVVGGIVRRRKKSV